jgi:uncharacterized membrane protein YqjE
MHILALLFVAFALNGLRLRIKAARRDKYRLACFKRLREAR